MFIAPTPSIALFQRIYTRGPEDVAEVRTVRGQIRLAPLASAAIAGPRIPAYRHTGTRCCGCPGNARPAGLFQLCERLYEAQPTLDRVCGAHGGVRRGRAWAGYRAARWAAAFRQAISEGAKEGRTILNAAISEGPYRNGWRVPDPRGGKSGPYALAQAVLQITQIGSLRIDEAVYYVSRRDAGGEVLLAPEDRD